MIKKMRKFRIADSDEIVTIGDMISYSDVATDGKFATYSLLTLTEDLAVKLCKRGLLIEVFPKEEKKDPAAGKVQVSRAKTKFDEAELSAVWKKALDKAKEEHRISDEDMAATFFTLSTMQPSLLFKFVLRIVAPYVKAREVKDEFAWFIRADFQGSFHAKKSEVQATAFFATAEESEFARAVTIYAANEILEIGK